MLINVMLINIIKVLIYFFSGMMEEVDLDDKRILV